MAGPSGDASLANLSIQTLIPNQLQQIVQQPSTSPDPASGVQFQPAAASAEPHVQQNSPQQLAESSELSNATFQPVSAPSKFDGCGWVWLPLGLCGVCVDCIVVSEGRADGVAEVSEC